MREIGLFFRNLIVSNWTLIYEMTQARKTQIHDLSLLRISFDWKNYKYLNSKLFRTKVGTFDLTSVEGVKIEVQYFLFWLILNRKKRSRPIFVFILFLRQNRKFKMWKKFEKNKILAHRKKYFSTCDEGNKLNSVDVPA